MQEMKLVGDIFKDCTGIDTILDSRIETINLYKKSSKLEMKLIKSEKIDIEQISIFEVYLKEKFNIENVEITIKYDTSVSYNIDIEWTKIVAFVGQKYPSVKAVLSSSEVKVNGNEINIVLNIRGKELLKGIRLEKVLSELLENIYGTKYIIIYTENVEEDDSFIEYQIQAEQEAIAIAQKEALELAAQANEENAKRKGAGVSASICNSEEQETVTPLIFGRSLNIKQELIKVINISVDTDKVCIEGEVIKAEARDIKNDKTIVMFDVYDGTSTITCKFFIETPKAGRVLERIQNCRGIKIVGVAKYDQFSRETTIMVNTIIETPGESKIKRKDNSTAKRVELHLHTQMSQMDAITPIDKLLKRAVEWGMKAIAITDHGVVQSFPDAHKFMLKNKPDLKVIYGVEAYLVSDKVSSVFNDNGQDIDTTYCIIDIETTGLHFKTEKITEFGIIKMKDGEEIGRFECLVNPEIPIPWKVSEITHITDEMVADSDTIDKVMPKVLDFIGDSVLVAHNASFDMGFIKYNCDELGLKIENTYIDTLALSRDLFPNYKKYKLGTIAGNLGIKVENAHRALDDVITLMQVFNKMLDILKKKGVDKVSKIDMLSSDTLDLKNLETYHAVILAKDYVGLKNLYKLVSYSHLNYFNKKPKISKSLYTKHSSGLIIGSACEQGELYKSVLNNKSENEIEEIAKFYDYLEIQPIRKQ